MFRTDIHENMPTVKEAMDMLECDLKIARGRKEKIIEIVVGYGSTGGSHKIKDECIRYLTKLKENKKISDFICGGDIDIFNHKYHKFKDEYKLLLPEEEKIKRNRGAIFVVL